LIEFRTNGHDDDYDNMLKDLLKNDVLSMNETNNFSIWACGVVCNPRLRVLWGMLVYFTKQQYAEEYAKIKFANALYTYSIVEHKKTGGEP